MNLRLILICSFLEINNKNRLKMAVLNLFRNTLCEVDLMSLNGIELRE